TASAAVDVGLITVLVTAILIRSVIAVARNQFLPPTQPADRRTAGPPNP
ncbi:MAG: hypothetical protein QOF84_4321, partial [Streptomyces sp.]|nr:hypothetical protein [Streptomyces sp.]